MGCHALLQGIFPTQIKPPISCISCICCCCSVTQSCHILRDPVDCSMPGLPVPHHLLKFVPKFMFIASVTPSSHLILCRPLLLLPSIFPSIRSFPMSQLFTSGGQSIGGFSFNISPSNEHRALISFRMDWLDLLAVQGTLKSLF